MFAIKIIPTCHFPTDDDVKVALYTQTQYLQIVSAYPGAQGKYFTHQP